MIDWESSIFPLAEANQGLLTALALLPAGIGAFVYLFRRNRILSLESRPYVSLEWEYDLENKAVWLVLKNHGKLPAYKISVSAPSLVRPVELTKEKVLIPLLLQDISWLKVGVEALAPDQSVRTLFCLMSETEGEKLSSFSSTVEITYLDPNRKRLSTPKYALSLEDLGDGLHIGEKRR